MNGLQTRKISSMKILIPTDFSVYSDFATTAGVEIAKRTKGSIFLYHCADVPDDWEDLSAEIRYKDEYNKSKALWVRNSLEKIATEVRKEGVECTPYYTGGKFLKNLDEMMDKENFDLIVMGSHGASGKQEWFIGSNTQKVQINTLVVKREFKISNFEQPLFVTGLFSDDFEALKRYLDFLTYFDTKKLHLIAIDTSSFFTEPAGVMLGALEDFKSRITDFEVITHFYKGNSIDQGVRKYVVENDIDLIGISNHLRHPIKRFFKGSNVEILANHSDVPILSIDYN